MFRSLLGTLLIASQILNGLWANATLCLRSDGTVCCIHEFTQSCPCCNHDHEELKAKAKGHECHSHALCAIAENHETNQEESSSSDVTFRLGSPVGNTIPCGCQHRPLSSTTVPASKYGTSITASVRKASSPTIPQHFPGRLVHYHPTTAESRGIQSPACLSVGLTLVSSTVIRC